MWPVWSPGRAFRDTAVAANLDPAGPPTARSRVERFAARSTATASAVTHWLAPRVLVPPREEPQGVSLLGGMHAVPATWDRHTGAAVGRRLRGDVRVAVVRLVQPGVENLLTQREQRFIARRVTKVGEGAEHPVCAVPLRLGAGRPHRGERASSRRTVSEARISSRSIVTCGESARSPSTGERIAGSGATSNASTIDSYTARLCQRSARRPAEDGRRRRGRKAVVFTIRGAGYVLGLPRTS